MVLGENSLNSEPAFNLWFIQTSQEGCLKKDGSYFFPSVAVLYNTSILDLETNCCLSLQKSAPRETSSVSCKIWDGRSVPNRY